MAGFAVRIIARMKVETCLRWIVLVLWALLPLSLLLDYPVNQFLVLGVMLLSSALCAWRGWQWRRVVVETEPLQDCTLGTFIGDPEFDPLHGIIGNVEYGGEIFRIVIQPKWWQFFPSPALSRDKGNEGAISSSFVSRVSPSKEPTSLVCLENEAGIVVGMGARVKSSKGTHLLTANHVVDGGHPRLYIAKNGKRVEMLFDEERIVYCSDHLYDFALIEVPDIAWSKLGVGASPLKGMFKPALPVVCYGGKSSTTLMSSMGKAFRNPKRGCLLSHTCTTTGGWSGTPLYSQGCVVGVHTGTSVMGVSNRGMDVNAFVTLGDETEWGNVPFDQMSMEDFESLNGSDSEEITVHGRGRFRIASTGFTKIEPGVSEYKPIGKDWRDYEDDKDDFYDLPENSAEALKKRFEGNETILNSNLNCQGAAGQKSSLPSVTSVSTHGKPPCQSPKKECHSSSVEDRLSNLESLVERLLQESVLLRQELSLNSKSLTGLIEERKQSEIPCSSKPAGSAKQRNRRRRNKRSSNSSTSTPTPAPESVSAEKNGMKSKSPESSRTSVKGKLTATPPPASR